MSALVISIAMLASVEPAIAMRCGNKLVNDGDHQTKVLKYIEKDKPELLDPVHAARTVVGVRIAELIFRGLVSQNENGDWEPELAAAMPDFNFGSRELTVRLKSGLSWPDGRAFTAILPNEANVIGIVRRWL